MGTFKVRIITSCTGEKLHSPENQLQKNDFDSIHDSARFGALEESLKEYRLPSEQIYTGQQHVRLMKGVKIAREKFGVENVDLRIVSAGYGLISADRSVVPYECTFQGMKNAQIDAWSEHLGIPEAAKRVFEQKFDLTIVLLGDAYLRALRLDDSVVFGGPTFFFCSSGSRKLIRGQGAIKTVQLSNEEAKRFSCGLVGLKGELAARILNKLKSDPREFVNRMFAPGDVLPLFDETGDTVSRTVRSAPMANPNVDRVISIPDSWWQKPHRSKLRYFIPEWDDLVDPDYDFETDTHSGGGGDWSNETYAHQMYAEPNYDGILISKVVAEKSVKKKERINRMGVHRFLRVPDNFAIMGDCGAFGYIMDEVPPYTTAEILEYYTRLGFNYGVSIDHLIVKATEDQKRFRYDLTINNAEEFLVEHRKLGLDWEPIGAVQGWSPESYADAARKYVAMGYKYIALGGLVRYSTAEVLRIVTETRKLIPSETKLHLFGLARFKAINDFAELGVSSIDSASVLRQAWLGAKQNYLTLNGWYSAIRIPQSDKSFRAKRLVQEGTISAKELAKLEQACLDGLRKYQENSSSNSQTLIDSLVHYDTLVAGERGDTRDKISRTINDRPWERCGCSICKESGVEVLIFRGNNRNRRRGFHNTHIFYQMLEKKIAGQSIPWIDDGETDRQPSLFEFATL